MTDDSARRISRRDLVAAVLPASAALLLVRSASAQDALPHVDESDPTAQALGYVHDAKLVDKAANPMFKDGSMCANCAQLMGNEGDEWRPCNIFPGKLVNSHGWCKVWAPKA
jgi:hypothetical protein